MTITQVGSASVKEQGTNSTGFSDPPVFPAGVQAGDYAVCVMSLNSISTTQDIQDFTLLETTLSSNNESTTPRTSIFVRACDGSESSDALVITSSSTVKKAALTVWRGVDPTTPIDVQASDGLGATTNFGFDIDPSVEGCLIIYVAAANASTGTWSTPTVPGTWTQVFDDASPTPSTTSGQFLYSGSHASASVDLTRSTSVRGSRCRVALRPGPSGQNLTHDQTDNANPSDATRTIAMGHSLPRTDNANPTDASRSISLGHIFNRLDSVSLTDTAIVSLVKDISASNLENLTDTVQIIEAHAHVRTDALGVSDLATPSLGHLLGRSDTESLTDLANTSLGHGFLKSDGVTLTDSVQVALAALMTVAQSDNVVLTDTSLVELIKLINIAQTDPVALTDAISIFQGGVVTRTDIIGLSDTVSVARALFLAATNNMPLSDQATVASAYVKALQDVMGLTDQTQVDLMRLLFANPTDVTGQADVVLLERLLAATPVDTVGLADTMSMQQQLRMTVEDLSALDDELLFATTFGEFALDDLDMTDLVSVTMHGLYTPALAPIASMRVNGAYAQLREDLSFAQIETADAFAEVMENSASSTIEANDAYLEGT